MMVVNMPFKDVEDKKAYQQQYYQNNRENLLEYRKQYNHMNYLKRKEYMKKYYLKYKERINTYSKKYNKEHPEKIKEIHRNWNHQNPDYILQKILRINGKRRVIEKRLFNGICELCGQDLDRALRSKKRPHWHHWDDEQPELGIWVCPYCHGAAEAHDQNGLEVPFYEEIKELIIKVLSPVAILKNVEVVVHA